MRRTRDRSSALPVRERNTGASGFTRAIQTQQILPHGCRQQNAPSQSSSDYVKAADTRHANRLAHGLFLVSDEVAGQTTNLRNGGVVVTPASQQVPLKVQSGLIHDWTGAAFIPKAKLHDVLPVLRDYDRYKDYYRPNVVYANSWFWDFCRDIKRGRCARFERARSDAFAK